jgi:hypothetical protein
MAKNVHSGSFSSGQNGGNHFVHLISSLLNDLAVSAVFPDLRFPIIDAYRMSIDSLFHSVIYSRQGSFEPQSW